MDCTKGKHLLIPETILDGVENGHHICLKCGGKRYTHKVYDRDGYIVDFVGKDTPPEGYIDPGKLKIDKMQYKKLRNHWVVKEEMGLN